MLVYVLDLLSLYPYYKASLITLLLSKLYPSRLGGVNLMGYFLLCLSGSFTVALGRRKRRYDDSL